MKRLPRNPHGPLFDRRNIDLSLLQGASVLLIVLAVYVITLYREKGELEARAMAFTTLIIANLALIFTNRSSSRTILETLRSPNAALGRVLAGALAFLGLVLYVPFLRELFRFNELHLDDLLITLAAGLISILWFEVIQINQQEYSSGTRIV
jgi:P-type Ca2+ transporter type 2C